MLDFFPHSFPGLAVAFVLRLLSTFCNCLGQAARRTLDFIIDTVSGHHSLGPILELLKVNGTLAVVGAPDKPFEMPSFPLIFGKNYANFSRPGLPCDAQEIIGQNTNKKINSLCIYFTGKRTVKGSIIGGMADTQEMMDVCGKHNITCDIEIITPDQINEAMERLANNDVRYRFVIDIATNSSNI